MKKTLQFRGDYMIMIGMMIGDRYEILDKIGTGGMSDVYKAKCHKLNRYVAVKVLKQEFSENTNFVSKFRVEAQAAAGLMHPNIVNVYDVGEENGIFYIVMELVEGITLKNYIEKKARLSMKEAISIAIQVSMGIEAAHNNHIIHRDIKPQNILISKEGKVKIADFGIAKAATSNTITSNVMGSVHYTSPEQARGGFSDERSDIYSLGCTMYEMLTGRVPFDGETTVAIAIKHIQEEMPSPREFVSEIPVCVEKIIFKCTQKSPDRRYQSMSQLISDLKQSLITPDEDFVTIISSDTGGQTRVISEADIQEIKASTGELNLSGMRLAEEQPKATPMPEPIKEAEVQIPKTPTYEEEDVEEEEDEEEDEKPLSWRERRDLKKEEEYDDDDDTRMEKITTILAIVAAVIIGILALFIASKMLGGWDNSSKKNDEPLSDVGSAIEPEVTEMIQVVGMNVEDAKKALNEIGLGTKVTRQESDEYDPETVISQSVEAGETVDLYSTIDLVVSTGSDAVAVSNVVGKKAEDAESELKALGFEVSIETEHSDSVAKDEVMSQDPAADTKLKPGDKVTLKVSGGPEIIKVKVPDLRGMTESAAKDKLSLEGLKCGSVSETYSDNVTQGCVVSQSMSVGEEVEQGTSVNITLSAGPEKHTYKYVTTLDAPSGYVGGSVVITIKGSDGDTRSFTATSFPVAVNETKFAVKDGTITYSYKAKKTQSVIDAETGEEKLEEVEEEVTTSPAQVSFTEE